MKEHFAVKVENAGKFADGFVKAAKNITGQSPDFSKSSIGLVEGVIESFREGGAPKDKISDTLFSIGCYLGEVFVRNGYGHWVDAKATPMKNFCTAPFVIQLGPTTFCNPIDKVEKRFENGEEDSLAFFFENFSARAKPVTTKSPWWKKLFGG